MPRCVDCLSPADSATATQPLALFRAIACSFRSSPWRVLPPRSQRANNATQNLFISVFVLSSNLISFHFQFAWLFLAGNSSLFPIASPPFFAPFVYFGACFHLTVSAAKQFSLLICLCTLHRSTIVGCDFPITSVLVLPFCPPFRRRSLRVYIFPCSDALEGREKLFGFCSTIVSVSTMLGASARDERTLAAIKKRFCAQVFNHYLHLACARSPARNA